MEFYIITDAPAAAEWQVVAIDGRGRTRTLRPEAPGTMLNQYGAELQPGQTGWLYYWTERVEVFMPGESEPIYVIDRSRTF